MFITVKKWQIAYAVCILAVLIGFGAFLRRGNVLETYQPQSVRLTMPTLILDPGHGGEDGGAVSPNGTIESHINLAIAMNAADIASLFGQSVCMTRDTDISIHDAGAETLREKKVSDLKNRTQLCNSVSGGVLISIHQNSLPGSPKTRGAQVFYGNVEGSRELALAIQEALNDAVNYTYPKTVKAIGDSSYLMKNVSCPAVLVECGFLSNAEDEALLNDDVFRKKIAAVIVTAAKMHLSRE